MSLVGKNFPDVVLRMVTAEAPQPVQTEEIFKGKKVVLFGVPGAFTPTCHKNHLPGFVENADKIHAKGVDDIYVVSVNDAFVMKAWKGATDTADKIKFLADGNAELPKALDLLMDGTANGMGIRLKRFSMVIDNGKVTKLNVEDAPGKAEVSGAVNLLTQLK